MKFKSLSLLAAIAIGALALAGCSTQSAVGGSPPASTATKVTPERVKSIARLAAFGSAKGFLISHPEYRPELVKAKSILVTLVSSQQWSIDVLAGAFRDAGFKELRSEEGILAVEGAILMIDVFTGRQIDLKNSVYAEAAIVGALDGVNLALANSPDPAK